MQSLLQAGAPVPVKLAMFKIPAVRVMALPASFVLADDSTYDQTGNIPAWAACPGVTYSPCGKQVAVVGSDSGCAFWFKLDNC